ncbi:unnamed protein product, partial [Iphiclides podalirius]
MSNVWTDDPVTAGILAFHRMPSLVPVWERKPLSKASDTLDPIERTGVCVPKSGPITSRAPPLRPFVLFARTDRRGACEKRRHFGLYAPRRLHLGASDFRKWNAAGSKRRRLLRNAVRLALKAPGDPRHWRTNDKPTTRQYNNGRSFA